MRIGLFGGTFDPVHNGHIALAEDARDQAALDRVLFIPAWIQPFKQERKTASGEDRYAMIQAAIEGKPSLAVSDYELKKGGVSYTIDTLRHFEKVYGTDELYFLCAESFLKVELWKDAAQMLRHYRFLVGVRPGYADIEIDSCISRVREKFGTQVIRIENRPVAVSSTARRSKTADAGAVPEAVERYIKDHGLYQGVY